MNCDIVGFECATHDRDVTDCIERLETESKMMQQVNRDVRALVGAKAGEGTADAVARSLRADASDESLARIILKGKWSCMCPPDRGHGTYEAALACYLQTAVELGE